MTSIVLTAILGLTLLFLPKLQSAPSVSIEWRGDTLQPLLGEPIRLELSVTAPTGTTIYPTSFTIPTSDVVLESVVIESDTGNADAIVFRQILTLRFWTLTPLDLPQFRVEYQLPNNVASHYLDSLPLRLEPRSVLDLGDMTLRGLPAPLLPPANIFNPVYILPLIGAVVLIGILIANRLLHGSSPQEPSIAERLAQLGKGHNLTPEDRATAVVNLLREYLRELYPDLDTNVPTTELKVAVVNGRLFNTPNRDYFVKLIEKADALRFFEDNHVSPQNEVTQLIEQATSWVKRPNKT